MNKYKAVAYHLGKKLTLKTLEEQLSFKEVKSERSFVLLDAGENAWIYIKSYGSVVFFNCSDDIIRSVLKTITGDDQKVMELPNEDYRVEVDPKATFNVDFSVIRLPQISDHIAHLIMLNMAQSVSLESFSEEVNRLLSLTMKFSDQLDKSGKFKMSRRMVRKYIGQTMVLRNKIAENLFIFETPDVAWDDPDLASIDEQMRHQLELEKRHEGLQLNLTTVKENLDVYRDILQHRHSSTLEWIIILLILFEVIQVIIEKS